MAVTGVGSGGTGGGGLDCCTVGVALVLVDVPL